MKFLIEINDETKAKSLMVLLNSLDFVKDIKVISEEKGKKPNFESIFGLWKNREENLDRLRKKAWGELWKT